MLFRSNALRHVLWCDCSQLALEHHEDHGCHGMQQGLQEIDGGVPFPSDLVLLNLDIPQFVVETLLDGDSVALLLHDLNRCFKILLCRIQIIQYARINFGITNNAIDGLDGSLICLDLFVSDTVLLLDLDFGIQYFSIIKDLVLDLLFST